MKFMGNLKTISLLAVRIYAKKSAVSSITIFITSVVIAYAAGYSIVDFINPQDESAGAYSFSDSRPSFTDDFGYAKLIDIRSLRWEFVGACYINRAGYVKEDSYSITDAAPRAFISGDGIMKNFGAPAVTYGTAGGVDLVAVFNNYGRSDFNIPESPISGWYPNVAKGSSKAGSGGPVGIYFPPSDPGTGSDSGSGSGSVPVPTPIPAALPLFGSGLVFLFVLRNY